MYAALITSFYLEQNGIDNERVSMNEGSTIRLDNKVSNGLYGLRVFRCVQHTLKSYMLPIN